jgi:hypothetical protein
MSSQFLCAATAIVTLRSKIGNGDSNLFGGQIIARTDDDRIKTIADIRGRQV